mmetsp:Transcript_1077/g.1886  ORF Transcript_1077/g.1886 Transcript_1077/m.1886 type:complete len:129 (-) Transcript_1077:895-1281(-)
MDVQLCLFSIEGHTLLLIRPTLCFIRRYCTHQPLVETTVKIYLLYSPRHPGTTQSMTPPSPTTRSTQSVVDVPVPADGSFKDLDVVGQVLSILVNLSKSNPAFAAASLTAGTAALGRMGSLAYTKDPS